MQSRIKAKLLVILALVTLVLNVFTSFSTAFVQAKTTSSGYKIDVQYQDGIAQLKGNVKDVVAGCKLLQIVDDETQQSYDPNSFTLPVTQNKTYSFTLSYSFDGISQQPQSEKIEVNVDKLPAQTTRMARSLQNGTAVPLTTLAEMNKTTNQSVSVSVYPYENYDSTGTLDVNELGKINIPSGYFNDNGSDINDVLSKSLTSREYTDKSVGTLKRKDGTEFPIVGVWSNANKIYYAPLNPTEQPDGNGVGIAYQAMPNDQIRLYCSIKNPSSHQLDTSAISSNSNYMNFNIAPNPSDSGNNGKIRAGSNVVVTFDWANSINNVNVYVKYGNKQEALKVTGKYNVNTRKYQGTFTMPDQDAQLVITPVNKQSKRLIGVYDTSDLYYQALEIGGTKIDVDQKDTSFPKQRTYNQQAWSKVYRDYGLDSQGFAKYPIYNNADSYSGGTKDPIYRKYYEPSTSQDQASFRKQSSQGIYGYQNKDSKTKIWYPVQDYQAGQKIVINYKTKRGVANKNRNTWWSRYDGESYMIAPPTYSIADIFPHQEIESNQDTYQRSFDRYKFKMYQSKEAYEADPNKSKYTAYDTSKGQAAGLYPVSTTLENGVVITVYPTGYGKNSALSDQQYSDDACYVRPWGTTGIGASGPYDNSLGLLEANFKIVITNCWDDIRISNVLGSKTTHEWVQVASSPTVKEIFARGDTNSNIEFSSENMQMGSQNAFTMTGKNTPVAQTTTGVNVKYHYFKVKVPEGYSAPIPNKSIHDYKANTTKEIYGKNGVFPRITGNTKIDVSKVGEKFIAGRLKGKNINGLEISEKPLYENGYYYYSLLANHALGSETIVSFESSPIKFNVSYQNLQGISGSYDVEKQQYFSVPVRLPSLQKGQFFKGWNLIVTGKGIPNGKAKINIGSLNGGLYAPNDLVDIVKVNDEINKLSLTQDAVGQTEYKLEFQPEISTAATPTSGNGVIYQYYQNSPSAYDTKSPTKTTYQLLKGSSVQITGVKNSVNHQNVDYQKNENKSSELFIASFEPVKDGDATLASIYYDKKILVAYDKGQNASGSVPTDDKSYSTISGSSASVIDIATLGSIVPPANKKFMGWKLKVDKSNASLEGKALYQPSEKLDLSSLSKEGDQAQNLRQAIFDAGKVTLVAQYADTVSQIKSEDDSIADKSHPMSENGQWIYEHQGYTISAKFKYAGSKESYKVAKDAGLINYALYKKDPTNNGSESQANYSLWWSNKKTTSQNSKIASQSLSDNLNDDGTFTATFKIVEPKSEASISYRWDNNAKYKIVAWSSVNETENGFDANGSAPGTLTNSATFSKIPAVSILTRVLQPFNIVNGDAGANNSITKRKLMYRDQKLTTTFTITTANGVKLSVDELKAELKIAIAKKDPKASDIKLWYSNTKLGNFGPGTTSPGGSSPGKKFTEPEIKVANTDSSGKGSQFTVTVANISDETPANNKWQSDASYYVYAWNNANTIPPTVVQKNGAWVVNNNDAINVPRKIYTTYIINDTKVNGTSETAGKAFYGTVSYPSNIKMQENVDTKKVESTMQKVELNAVWVDSDTTTLHTNNGGITPDNATTPVEHDFSYTVKLQGGDVQSDGQTTKLNMTQGSNKLVASILKDGNAQIPNGNLGTLDFKANNPNAVRSLNFKLQTDSIPTSLTKDAFSGNLQYVFTRNEIGGNAS